MKATQKVVAFSVAVGVIILAIAVTYYQQTKRQTNFALYSAALKGDAATVKRLLAEGADPSFRGSTNYPVLAVAMTGGDPAAVQALLDNGADINAQDPNGMTALSSAVFSGWHQYPPKLTLETTDCIGRLLAKGPDVNIRDSKGKTALMYAAELNDIVIVKALLRLSKGADLNIRDNSGRTALSYVPSFSFERSEQEIRPLLQAAGAKE
jgi:ankyrin repeat protein